MLGLTFPARTLTVVLDLPTRLVINFHEQHNSQVTTTGGSTLLGTSFEQGYRASGQNVGGSIVVGLFDVTCGDDTELLVRFIVSARGNSRGKQYPGQLCAAKVSS